MAAQFRPSLDYTDKDFDALRVRARQLISAAFPEWTDDNVANFGNILVDLHCFVGDVLGFYQDKQARETRWTQAKQRKNLLALVKLIGFRPTGATAATAAETFTLTSGAAAADVILPKGTIVRTLEVTAPSRYQLLSDLTIPAGQTVATATVENSEFQSDAFASNGLANQSFTLTRTPYVDGSAVVVAANGAYTQVDNFLRSGPTDRHFVVVVDQNDRARLDFGNGINGQIPSGTIAVEYKTGGGLAGRVEAGKLTKLEGNPTDAFGNPVTIGVTNVLKSDGGADRQSNESIRQLAPESVRVSDRTVAREDFEIVAKKVPTVSRALMVTKNEDPGISENSGILFLVPPGSGTVSQGTIDAVTAQFLIFPYTTTFQLAVQGAAYLVVNVRARIFLAKGAVPATVKAAVVASLGAFFAVEDDEGTPNPLIDFGFNYKDANGDPDGFLALSDVFNVVRDTVGVRKVDPSDNGFQLNGLPTDLAIENKQFPKLGTITLIDADLGVEL